MEMMSIEKWFNHFIQLWIERYPDLKKHMMDSRHYYTDSNGVVSNNPYHMEDSVWAHTMMVCVATKCFLYEKYGREPVSFSKIAVPMISAIVHDVGKIYVRYEKHLKKRASFDKHGPHGTLHALDFATYVISNSDLPECEKKSCISQICFITSRHMDYKNVTSVKDCKLFFNYSYPLTSNMQLFNNSDCEGRFLINQPKDKEKNDRENFDGICEQTLRSYIGDGYKAIDPSDIDVWLYCGIPGSGKDYQASLEKFNIISYDKISVESYKALSGISTSNMSEHDLYMNAYEYGLKTNFDMNKAFNEELSFYYRKHKGFKNLAICNTMLTPKSRRKVILSLQRMNPNVKIGIRFVLTPLDICIENDKNRTEKTIGETTIKRFSGMVLPEHRKHYSYTGIILPNMQENVDLVETVIPYI